MTQVVVSHRPRVSVGSVSPSANALDPVGDPLVANACHSGRHTESVLKLLCVISSPVKRASISPKLVPAQSTIKQKKHKTTTGKKSWEKVKKLCKNA